MSEATEPMFEVVVGADGFWQRDPLELAVKAIVPQASREQVLRLRELVAAEAERIARPPKKAGAFR